MDDLNLRVPGVEEFDPEVDAMAAAAADLIRQRYEPDRHSVAAAVRDADGRVHLALNLDAYVGRAAICAEAIALGKAIAAGAAGIQAIVAVRHPRPSAADQRVRVVAPCGLCRELLIDYAPSAVVLTPLPSGGLALLPTKDLLPERFERHDKPRRS